MPKNFLITLINFVLALPEPTLLGVFKNFGIFEFIRISLFQAYFLNLILICIERTLSTVFLKRYETVKNLPLLIVSIISTYILGFIIQTLGHLRKLSKGFNDCLELLENIRFFRLYNPGILDVIYSMHIFLRSHVVNFAILRKPTSIQK